MSSPETDPAPDEDVMTEAVHTTFARGGDMLAATEAALDALAEQMAQYLDPPPEPRPEG